MLKNVTNLHNNFRTSFLQHSRRNSNKYQKNYLSIRQSKLSNHRKLPIVAITGAVASGKNFIAKIFAKSDFAIFDADLAVHKILNEDLEIIKKISLEFSHCLVEGKINRAKLGLIVFDNPNKLALLEQIIYPALQKNYQNFLEENKDKAILINIPLFFEKKNFTADIVISLIAPKNIRKKRFLFRQINNDNRTNFNKTAGFRLNRKGQIVPIINISKEYRNIINNKFENINRNQLTNLQHKKLYNQKLVNYLINTNCSKKILSQKINKILADLKN